MLLLSIVCVSVFNAIYAQEVNKIGSDLSSRILYGTKANIKDYPYFAGLSTCGAAIISERWLVTAAHCVVQHNKFVHDDKVSVGGEDFLASQRYYIDKVVVHPKYDISTVLPGTPVNDIALLRLRRPLKFSNTVKAVTLPREDYKLNAVHYFAGRGLDENLSYPKQLMKVDLYTVGADECLSHMWIPKLEQQILRPHLNQLKQVAFCAKRIQHLPGLCYGDSGSPLVRNNTLVGVASFIPNTDCRLCRVGFFTNVAHFVSWITAVTGIK